MSARIAGVVATGLLAMAVPVRAHHSFTMFDHEKTITISGTVKEFEWTNPHCWLHIVAVDPATGRNVDWSFEMGSIVQISSQGWRLDSVKAGDRITVSGHPLKDGTRGAQYQSAKLASGKSFEELPDVNNQNAVK